MKNNKAKAKRFLDYRRLLCTLLAVLMTASLIVKPGVKAEANNIKPLHLEAERISGESLPNGNLVYFGTESATLDESDLYYTVPIYREGDLSGKVKVELRTIDMTAVYGKDYELAMPDVKNISGGKTVLESYMEELYAFEDAVENGELSVADISQEALELSDDSAESSQAEKSSLAQLKESATGEPTRDTYETEFQGLSEGILNSITPEVAQSIDYSAFTVITFEEGESEKYITFRLKDDTASEGTESFSLFLADSIGAEVYQVTSLSVSITDNDKAVQSEVSFTDASYDAKNGKVKLKVKRTAAEYSLVDMRIYTSEDTAQAGVNYNELDTTLAFMPYETEKEIELDVAGEGSFSVAIENFTACQAGKYTEAKINISAGNGAEVLSASSGDSEEFEIILDNKKYKVVYVPGEPTGKIMDPGYTPNLEVGIYYFALPKENGGYMHYSSSQYSGDKPNFLGTLDCEYVNTGTQHTSYGDVAYYHSTVWKKGKIWAYGDVAMPGVYFQYIAADWQSSSNFGGGQKFSLNSSALNLSTYVTGKFSRTGTDGITATNGVIKIHEVGNTNNNKNFQISVDAIDDSASRTPKSYLRFYGVAAMYKKYNVSISDPVQMSYLTGNVSNGIPETAMFTPVQVNVKCGAQPEIGSGQTRDIYANPDSAQSNLVFSVVDSKVNGTVGKFGVIKGYTITVGPDDAQKQVQVSYPSDFLAYLDKNVSTTGKCADYSSTAVEKEKAKVTGNLDTVPYDAYFIDWIDTVQKDVISSSFGYLQKLRFTPIIGYEDVEVKVLPPKGGGSAQFVNYPLKNGDDYTRYYFHAGDVLDLRVSCDDPLYTVDGYEVSYDGGINFDGPIRSVSSLQLLPGHPNGYVIRPAVVVNDNRIELRFINGAENIFTVSGVNKQGLIDSSLLQNNNELAGRYILNLDPNGADAGHKMMPVVGEVYSIIFLSNMEEDGYIYRPMIIDGMTGKVYTTNRLDFKARNEKEDNLLTVGYEKVAIGDMLKFTVSGTLISNYVPIVSDGLGTRRNPVPDYNVSLPGIQKTVVMEKTDDDGNKVQWSETLIDSVSAVSDRDGSFIAGNAATDTYVYGKNGDCLTMTVSNGSDIQVVDIVLGGTATGEWANTQLGEQIVVYPYNAPKIVSLTYQYQDAGNNNSTDENYNSIKIFDDTITFTAVVRNIIDSEIHRVSELRFGIYDAAGELTGTAVAKNPDSTLQGGTFSVSFKKMNQVFQNGERLRVSVVEQKTGKDINGNSVTYDVVYPEVDSGFVFYIENTKNFPKEYTTTETTPINIPIMGASSASASTGLVSFSKTEWGNDSLGRVTGYTLSVNADVLCKNTASSGTKDKLSKFDSLRASAKKAQADLDTIADYKKTLENSALNALATAMGPRTEEETQQLEALDKQKELFYANESYLKDEAKQPLSGFTKAKTYRVDVLFVLAFDFILNVKDDGSTEYVFCSGSVAAAVTANYNKSFYSVLYGVPVFINFTGTIQGDMLVSYHTEEGGKAFNENEFNEYTGNLAEHLGATKATFGLTASLMAQAGAGMCNVLSARGYAKFGLQFSVPTVDTREGYGVLLMASGGIGFDLLVLSINFDIGNFKEGFGIYENMSEISFFGQEVGKSSLSSGINLKAGKVETIKAEEYAAGTDDMSAFGYNGLIGATPEEVSRSVLLKDAADRTRPQLVLFDDGSRMVFFIGNRGGEGLNSMALYYSVYRGGVWSEPQLVSDDGTLDTNPTVLQRNGKVIVAWVDANRKYNDSDNNIEKLNALGISAAIYENGVMGDEMTLADDEFFNFAPQLSIIGDTLYCSYMKRDISNVASNEELLDLTATYSTMAYVKCDVPTRTVGSEQFITIKHPTLIDPLVLDYQSAAINAAGVDYTVGAYTVDEDGDLNTVEDRELFLAVNDVGIDLSFAPIQLTNDEVGQSSPKLTDINGILYLTWVENGALFNLIDVNDLLTTLLNSEGSASVLLLGSAKNGDENWYRKTSAQLGMDGESYERSVFEQLYNGNIKTEKDSLQKDGNSSVNISNYILATNGDDIYVFYTAAGGNEESDTGIELFGARYHRDMDSAEDTEGDIDDTSIYEKGGFGKSVQITDYGKVIDEFDLCMTENNDIYMVSNHFDQWMDEDGNVNYGENELVEIKFSPRGSLSVVNDKIELPYNMAAGHTENLSFTVLNDGLLTTTGYDYTLSLVKGDTETVISAGARNVELDSGETDKVELSFTVPESTENTSVKLVINEHDVAIQNPTELTVELPYTSLVMFSDTEIVYEDGECFATTRLKNIGNKDTNALTAKLALTENASVLKTYTELQLPALKSGDSVVIKLPFAPDVDDFNHLGYTEMRISLSDSEGKSVAETNALFVPCVPVTAEINGGEETLGVEYGGTRKVSTEIAPWGSVAGNVVYTTDDPTVATVDENGNVHGAGYGTTVLRAYYPATGVTDSISVTVGDGVTYPTVLIQSDGGVISVSNTNPVYGETVTVTVTPDDGYTLSELQITDESGNTVSYKSNGDGNYSYVQPQGVVTITAVFIPVSGEDTPPAGDSGQTIMWLITVFAAIAAWLTPVFGRRRRA